MKIGRSSTGRQQFACPIKRRARQNVAQKKYTESEKGKATIELYERGEGYVKRRKRVLLKNRERVINQLKELPEDGSK